ncbi:uncharacterized protein LOC111359664 [Spodoptera litura]|uniref:Uncharacterized protein LOC111359664 n=1 Tax=Spodoptera litura TaxID=69820 RepID=A0A9J7EHY1_SPOLT|nr:uncharacterized protein LOC111359664 [Spodoptera litura]
MVDTTAAPIAAATAYTPTAATPPLEAAAPVDPCQDHAVDSPASEELIAVEWPSDSYIRNRNVHLTLSLLTFVTLSALSILWFLTEYSIVKSYVNIVQIKLSK